MTPEAFRALRRHLGLKQRVVGASIGLSECSVSKFERGDPTAPPPARFDDAAAKLIETWRIWEAE